MYYTLVRVMHENMYIVHFTINPVIVHHILKLMHRLRKRATIYAENFNYKNTK